MLQKHVATSCQAWRVHLQDSGSIWHQGQCFAGYLIDGEEELSDGDAVDNQGLLL